MVELSVEARQELVWWTQDMQEYNGAPLMLGSLNMVIESDATHLGWGTTLKGQGQEDSGQPANKRCTLIAWNYWQHHWKFRLLPKRRGTSGY